MKRNLTILILFLSLVCLLACSPISKQPEATSNKTDNGGEESGEMEREKSQIGIWYSVWYTSQAGSGHGHFWDDEDIYYKPLLPDGSYGRYDSLDDEIIDYHLREISGAEIDFIIMDQTNDIDVGGGFINQRAIKMARSIREWNSKPENRPIRYCSGVAVFAAINNDLSIIESEAKILWERYVNRDWGKEDSHVYVDGKPLMVLFGTVEEQWEAYTGDKTYADRFTIRYSVGHAREPDMWGWVMPEGTIVTEDVAVIMPGWFKFNHPDVKVYRDGGRWYEEAWETLIEQEISPRFVVINSFNEYAEHTAVFTADTTDFPSDYPIERWIDKEGNLAPSLYWDMTKEYIQAYKKSK